MRRDDKRSDPDLVSSHLSFSAVTRQDLLFWPKLLFIFKDNFQFFFLFPYFPVSWGCQWVSRVDKVLVGLRVFRGDAFASAGSEQLVQVDGWYGLPPVTERAELRHEEGFVLLFAQQREHVLHQLAQPAVTTETEVV